MAEELVLKGHNVTFVSCDSDESQPNLHFIHMEKVYETVESSLDSSDLDITDNSFMNIIQQYFDTPQLTVAVCEGLVKSNGWHQLNNYPNDFMVKTVRCNIIHKFSSICLFMIT